MRKRVFSHAQPCSNLIFCRECSPRVSLLSVTLDRVSQKRVPSKLSAASFAPSSDTDMVCGADWVSLAIALVMRRDERGNRSRRDRPKVEGASPLSTRPTRPVPPRATIEGGLSSDGKRIKARFRLVLLSLPHQTTTTQLKISKESQEDHRPSQGGRSGEQASSRRCRHSLPLLAGPQSTTTCASTLS